jgi:hypothetical protein
LLLDLLKRWSGEGFAFETLGETAARAAAGGAPVCALERATAEGRAGWMSVQGPPQAG